MTDRVVIAGATGFIGRYLTSHFTARGATVTTIGRSGDVQWGDAHAIRRALDGSSVLVNLAGKSVNCRYNDTNRAEILRSRTETTRELRQALASIDDPPRLWINSSTATIYRHAEDRPMDEPTGELGEGFSVSVARAWEEEFLEGELPRTRRVALRMAIVLGDGSALIPLVRLAQLGFGGGQWDGRWWATTARRRAGTFHEFRARHGRQKFSWIHVEDVARIIDFVGEHGELSGVLNASSPNPTDNVTFMRTVRRVLGVPIGIPLPRVALELGSIIIRTETELVLKSRWVVPQRLQEAGYQFAYPHLEPALRQILGSRRSRASGVVHRGV